MERLPRIFLPHARGSGRAPEGHTGRNCTLIKLPHWPGAVYEQPVKDDAACGEIACVRAYLIYLQLIEAEATNGLWNLPVKVILAGAEVG